ncbi:MAG: lipid-A-disaccharide synthase, partial [Elusimicrobiota bacterium]|nr:lipid-A-disaccharide synthase [Elusimicrobiota bacterium]
MAKIAPITKNILVVAGDPSGDLHAANLIKKLKEKDSELSITSIGGMRMKKESSTFIYNLVSVGAMGFTEPFKRFFLWIKLIRIIRYYMNEKKPACVIAIDFYGFNHQLIGLAAHRNIPIFYYIPPQVWASRPKRAISISKLAKHIFCIFPFEVDIYKKLGGSSDFMGHPLLDIVPGFELSETSPAKDENYPFKIGILPGSRKDEIKRHLLIFVKSFYKLKSTYKNSKGYIFATLEIPDTHINKIIESVNPQALDDIEIVREEDYRIRSSMDFSFTSSGTATLENALMGVPMVVAYKMPKLNFVIAKKLANIPYVSLVNILLKKPLVKELLQEKANP